MANTSNPFGFWQASGTGSAPTYEQSRFLIKNGNTTAAFFGDPMVMATGTTGLTTGYVTQAAAPQALAISGFALANGLVTATFTATTAPPVGSTLILNGLTTATTLNGSWNIVSSSTTTAVFAYPGGALSTQSTTGYVFTPIVGIFVGCSYGSTAQKKQVWSNYWPGTSDSNADVTAYIINDPNAQFLVQTANSNTTATAVGLASIGSTIGFSIGSGNTSNGISAAYADQYTLGANFPSGQYGQQFLPFRMLALMNQGNTALAGINGADSTTAFNNIIVGFNNTVLRVQTAY